MSGGWDQKSDAGYPQTAILDSVELGASGPVCVCQCREYRERQLAESDHLDDHVSHQRGLDHILEKTVRLVLGMRFSLSAHIFDEIRLNLALELEAQSEELARHEALTLLRAQYSDSAIITVFAKPKHEPNRGGGE